MRTLFMVLFVTFGFQSFGQIVNIENKRLTDNKQGFSGRADVNFNFIMNTRQLLQIGGRSRLMYLKKRNQFLIVGDQSFVKAEGADFVNRGFQHFRYNYQLKDSSRFYFEAFQQSQFNRIQRIDFRHLLGSGIRYDVIDTKHYQLSLGTGAMWEYEELVGGLISRDFLSTSFLSFDGQFNPSVGLNFISYFQPKITNAGDFRLSNETSIRFKINKYLSFRMIYMLMHDTRDIEGVRKTNYTFRNALQIKF